MAVSSPIFVKPLRDLIAHIRVIQRQPDVDFSDLETLLPEVLHLSDLFHAYGVYAGTDSGFMSVLILCDRLRNRAEYRLFTPQQWMDDCLAALRKEVGFWQFAAVYWQSGTPLTNIVSQANPVPWLVWLADVDIQCQEAGVVWYCNQHCNCNYIVCAGLVWQNYGYHGENLYNRFVEANQRNQIALATRGVIHGSNQLAQTQSVTG